MGGLFHCLRGWPLLGLVRFVSAWMRMFPDMTREAPSESIPRTSDDDARTKEARRVAEEYAGALREILGKLRRLLN